MRTLHVISRKINAMIVLIVVGLVLSISMSWHYYQVRATTEFEEETFMSELLAHGLPREAASILEENISKQPLSNRSMKLRKVLAEIYMNDLNEYEKALSELIFIREFEPKVASNTSGIEKNIRYCMKRLGRVYDIERRKMLDVGINPVINNVASSTVIRIGNKSVFSIDQLNAKLDELKFPRDKMTKEIMNALVSRISQEILLKRAADRSGVKETKDYLAHIKQFEENLILQKYLETEVFQDLKVTEADITNYITTHRNEFETDDRVEYSELVFDYAHKAEDYINQFNSNENNETVIGTPLGDGSGTMVISSEPDEVIAQNKNVIAAALPEAIKGNNWKLGKTKEFYGPVKVNDKWHVYQIHNVVPGQKMEENQAQQTASQRISEQKKQASLAQKINELMKKEDLIINKDVIANAFFPTASETKEVSTNAQDDNQGKTNNLSTDPIPGTNQE